jgi:hypothetical protein
LGDHTIRVSEPAPSSLFRSFDPVAIPDSFRNSLEIFSQLTDPNFPAKAQEVLVSACISAIQHVRRLRGGSQPQLLRASDGLYYVTKFQNNPQHVRVLANEMLATRLGKLLGLPVPSVASIEVCGWLIENTNELRLDIAGIRTAFKAGLHLGSAYAADPIEGQLFDYLPEGLLQQVTNLEDFARVIVLDKWTCNADGRQAVFSREAKRGARYRATFIDQGYCFNAGEWNFPDFPLRAEEIDIDQIWRIAAEIPAEWYESDTAGLNRLIEGLYTRRSAIRGLITPFRHSTRTPFPNWR